MQKVLLISLLILSEGCAQQTQPYVAPENVTSSGNIESVASGHNTVYNDPWPTRILFATFPLYGYFLIRRRWRGLSNVIEGRKES